MHLLAILVTCIFLWILFPKGFKYLVGTWVGIVFGGFFWGLGVIAFDCLLSGRAFVAFIVAGIVGGCVLAARG